MARLVVQPGSPTAWEIRLKPGVNSLGRGPANDFKLDDPSVSGSHCQIVVENGNAVIKDLGSTNGTFVNRAPVKEAVLQPGQVIRLGSLEAMFYADAPVSAGAAQPPVAPRPVPIAPALPPPRAAAPAGAVRVSPAATIVRAGSSASSAAGHPPAPSAAPPVVAAPSSAVGAGFCKHHPKTPGRYFCGHCRLFFCEVCITLRGHQKFCRYCGAECTPVQVQLQRPAPPKGFFASFPGAFVYPFRGSGTLVLLVSTIVLALGDFVSGIWWLIVLAVAAYGYVFCFMQNIIHATANGEEEMPDLPGLDDVFGGAFRMAVTVLICFILPVTFFVLKFFGVYDVPPSAQIATMVLGCLYFPMAFLAVAMKDTALAANPLVVIPAILKVPLGYLVTAAVVIGIYLLRHAGSVVVALAAGDTYLTRNMSAMFVSLGLRAVWTLISVYLLTVSMRTLGLLYVTNKDKFGWFDH